MKKIVFYIYTMLFFAGVGLFSFDSYADDSVDIYVTCDSGSCHTVDGSNIIWAEDRIKIGSTVSSRFNFDEDPTAIDMDFIGWYIYDMSSGAQIGTELLTTAQVNSYVVPNHGIKIVAQWTPRAGYPVKCHTEAVLNNDLCEPCTDVKVSLIFGDTCYSGYGFVTIPESVYSDWSGSFIYRLEPMNGAYIRYDGKWCNEICEWEGSVKSIKRHGSSYTTANYTGKGRDTTFPRSPVNDFFYEASFVAPEISIISNVAAADVITDTSVVPATYSVETQIYQSGASYDSALNAAQSTCGTNNVVVVDISLTDDQGTKVSQLSDYVEVKVDIPSTYTIQFGNTVVVYYLNDSGILEACESVYHDEDPNNRYVTFKTNHFSVYVLVETTPESEGTPEVVPTPEGSDDTSTEGSGNEVVDENGENDLAETDKIVEGEESVVTDESTVTDENVNTEQTEVGSNIATDNNSAEKVTEENNGKNLLSNPIIWIGGTAVLCVVFAVIFARKRR